jgi:signal peptidase I
MPSVHVVTRLARRALDIALIALILLVLAALALARVVPAVTGGDVFVVGGGSMEPTIALGSVVIDQPVTATDLSVGDVVSVRVGKEKAIFTHRVIRLVDHDGALWIQTKGDANEDQDPSIIPASAVIGRVAVAIPYAGYVVHLLSTPQGVFLVVALATLLLAATWLLESLEVDRATFRSRSAGEAVAG